MATNLITSDQLEADAVVPQCIDNQYVSDRIFEYLMENGVDYDDATVRKMREEEAKTEFIRSLVYSSQVVLNRVFMKNNEFLYQRFLPYNREDFKAFSSLMRNKVVVPFLYKESSLTENLDTGLRKEGDNAIQALAAEVGDVTCLRLATGDEDNRDMTDKMARKFGDGIADIRGLQADRRNLMATELFADVNKLHEAGWKVFDKALTGLADYAHQKRGELADENKALVRTHIYRDRLILPGGSAQETEDAIVLGRFRKPDQQNPFVLELKKIVDLVYNTNLPDMLGRYTFTPVALPSRTALQDDPKAGVRENDIRTIVTDREVAQYIQRTFMANTQRAMSLPLLHDLTTTDVLELRKLPEWLKFKDSQTRILKDPLNCAKHFEEFQKSFDQFQGAMSKWYNLKYQRARTEERYVNVVSFVIRIGGTAITLGLGQHPVVRAAVGALSNLIPQKVKGYAAKLMVGVYDLGKHQLDEQRSYSVELMRTNEDLTREEVMDLITELTDKSKGTPTGQEADQGKQ